jgi:hypothetical protein
MKMKSKLSEALALINELDNCERVTVLTAIIAVMPHYLTLQDFSGMLTLARWGGMLGSKDGDGIGDFSGLTLSTEGGKWTPGGEDE